MLLGKHYGKYGLLWNLTFSVFILYNILKFAVFLNLISEAKSFCF